MNRRESLFCRVAMVVFLPLSASNHRTGRSGHIPIERDALAHDRTSTEPASGAG